MNLFITHSHIPAIAACIVAESFYAEEENILVREISHNRMYSDRFSAHTEEYDEISRIISTYFPWKRVIEIEKRCTVIHDGSSEIPKVEFHNLEKLKMDIQNKIPSITQNDRLIATDNSSLLQYFFLGQCELHLLEHGASMYKMNFLNSPDNIYKKLRRILLSPLKGLVYPLIKRHTTFNSFSPQKVYLTDCGESYAAKKLNDSDSNVEIISIDCKDIVKKNFVNFEKIYSQEYPDDYKEISVIKNQMKKYKNSYIYLPQDIVGLDEYDSYLKAQLAKVNMDNSIFLIKKHTRDEGNYSTFFEDIGYKYIDITSRLNRYLPVEILLFLLDYPILVSSYSSSLLYAKWWLNQSPLFSEVVNSPYNSILMREYSGVYHDLQTMAC